MYERQIMTVRPLALFALASRDPVIWCARSRGVELLLACPGTTRSGWPVEADRRVKSAFTLTPQSVVFSAAALWAADKRPW